VSAHDPAGGLPVVDIGGSELGLISGQRIEVPDAPKGFVGNVVSGRRATAEDVKACLRFWLEARSEDFEWRDRSSVVDRATGAIYEVLLSDPLLSPDPGEHADLFMQYEGQIVYLRATNVTVDELERARAEQEKRAVEAEEAARKRRSREKQVPVRLSDLYPGDRYEVTLRHAAARLLDVGAQITVGPYGEVAVTLPASIIGGGVPNAILEQEARREAAHLAEVLVTGWRVVIAALAEHDADGGKKSLPERLPDLPVSIGGGAA
jgi:hypothetical protein